MFKHNYKLYVYVFYGLVPMLTNNSNTRKYGTLITKIKFCLYKHAENEWELQKHLHCCRHCLVVSHFTVLYCSYKAYTIDLNHTTFYYFNSLEVGGHWPLWRGWKNLMTYKSRTPKIFYFNDMVPLHFVRM